MSTHTEDVPPEHIIFGHSAAMRVVRKRVEKVAVATVPVVIQGESGTGKGVLARYIHSQSLVSAGPFVNVNCAAIPGTLLESELFGYEKGAFTGAYTSKPGWVEHANGGTLFLDGIDEIDLVLQAKLLQLLQDGQFTRIGGEEDISVQIRVICATNRPLEPAIAAGRFRADLYYRISVVSIQLPPLRLRLEDLPPLAAYFLERCNKNYHALARPITPNLLRLFESHSWPGNIRELQNFVERYVLLDNEDAIRSEILDRKRGHKVVELPQSGAVRLKKITRNAIQDLERKVILGALEANRWNRRSAARELKISYRTLLYKIRLAGLPSKNSSSLNAATEAASAAPSAD